MNFILSLFKNKPKAGSFNSRYADIFGMFADTLDKLQNLNLEQLEYAKSLEEEAERIKLESIEVADNITRNTNAIRKLEDFML